MIADQVLKHGHEEQFWIKQAKSGSPSGDLLSIELWVQAHHNKALPERLIERHRHANNVIAKILSEENKPFAKHRDFVNLIGALSTGLAFRYALDPDPNLIELWAKIATRQFREMQDS